MEVKVYATLRAEIDQSKIDVEASPGDTVRVALNDLFARYPALTPHIMSDDGELVNHVNIFLDGRNIRLIDGLDTRIQEGQRLAIFPPIGGGQRGVVTEHLSEN